jgi:twinkle protein
MSKDNKWPVVSIPQGAAGAARAIKRELEFVSSYTKVVIMMDNDEAGRKAALEIAQLLKPNQAYIAELPAKDPSELMMAGRGADILTAFWEAKAYRPDGIVQGADIWDDIIAEDDTECIPWPYDGLNKITHGLRKRELVTITAGSGVGKSQVCREIAYHLIQQGETIGYVALEENCKRTALGLMGLAINKPLHISKEGVSNADLKLAFDDTVGSGRVYLYDHFGSLSANNLLDKIRYLAKGCDVGWVVLDHLSIAVSGISAPEGERKAIDVLMTELRSIVEETGIGMILVSHLKRPEGNKGFEEGLAINLNSLRGSAAIAQLSDSVIGLERNQQSEDEANQVTVRVIKNRFSGETGVATKLYFNKETNRLSEAEFIQDEFNEY